MSTIPQSISYGSPEPERHTVWESPDGTEWYYDEEDGWVYVGGSGREWSELDESDFPLRSIR